MKFWLVLFSFFVSAFAQYMTLSDFAFMVSQKEKLNIVFDKSVDKNITVFVNSQSSVNYLSLLTAVLGANNLDSFRVSDTLVISESKTNNASFGFQNSSVVQSSFVSGKNTGFADAPLSMSMTNGRELPSTNLFKSFDKNSSSQSCFDCVYEPIKLNFLNEDDLEGFLKFSGGKHQYVKNINTLIFERPKDDNSTVERIYSVIKALDVPKNQVTIRITIYENNLNKLSDIGFNPSLSLDFSALSKSGGLLSASASSSFYASLRFLETQNASKVSSSTPFLLSNLERLVFNNIINIPFLDENFAFTYQGTNQSTKYKYKDVGFVLELLPTIVSDIVYLDFNLKFETVQNGGLLPTTTKKSLKNKFMLRRGELLVLAGIEKGSFLNTKEGLPWLNRIPIIGSLFSHDNKNDISETFNIAIEV
ncbi:MAG TPA: hypothetical protein PKW30_04750, partial [Campylobacterales bacterium]|nr:hypothetical protein [Campylobacterales bacterium]